MVYVDIDNTFLIGTIINSFQTYYFPNTIYLPNNNCTFVVIHIIIIKQIMGKHKNSYKPRHQILNLSRFTLL